jgi:phosphohistidine phosphatase
MDLILWRHADPQAGESESSRALSGKGRRQAANIAAWLDKHLPDSARILVSPATQAVQTAEALGRKFKIVAELAPGAQSASLLLAADWPESRQPVVIIGHQPSLGRVAALLLVGEEQELSLRKGGVWWLSNRSREDGHKVSLRAAICPDYI